MASFAMPQGVSIEQMLKVMGQEQPAEAEPVAEPEVEPAKPARKRARDGAGRLKADDPATPEDEAWESES